MELVDIQKAVGEFNAEGASRQQIMALQDSMVAMNLQEWQLDFPVEHIFAPGLYARQMRIPEGGLIVGKIHRHAHVNTISKGRVWVITEFSKEELVAPITFVSQPGTKRVVLAQEDTVWTTYHPTTETDLVKIEEQVIASSFEEYEAFKALESSSRVTTLTECEGEKS